MNLKNLPSCVLLGALCVGVADADWITSWGNGVQGVDFFINQLDPSITILKGNGNTYKFYSETFQNSGVPGVIDDITVDSGAAGDFTIWIQNDPTGAGASDVKQMNLQYAGGTSNLAAFRLSGDLGQLGPALAEAIGTMHVGTLSNDITCDSLFSLRSNSGNWDHTIEVAGDAFIIEMFVGSVTGTVHVGGNIVIGISVTGLAPTGTIQIDGDCAGMAVQGASPGSVTIGGDLTGTASFGAGGVPFAVVGSISVVNLSGSLVLSASLAQSGSIEVLQDLSGQITVADELLGPLHVFGNCTSTGGITVGGDLKGSITIDGDLAGSIDVGGELNDVFLGSGFIAVDGSYGSTAAITIQQAFASTTEFISCNNNGAAPGVWEIGATVTLWASTIPQVFTGDAPGERVRAATSVKGDMNNDGAVNGGDIDLFFFALGDPLAYAAAYPGLRGSLLYHGDCDCDGNFTGADIDPFFKLVGGGVPCVGFNFWEPEYVAWLIETHVRPERLDRAIELIDDYTRGEVRPERRRFWNAVLSILAPS